MFPSNHSYNKLNITRKATGFKCLQLTHWVINQATSKCRTDIWTKLAKKVENRKSEHHYEILHIQISLGIKFRLKLTLLNFWIESTQKGYFRTKKNENYHRILHFQVNLDSKFQLQPTILSLATNFQNKVYTSGQKQKKMNITIEFFVFGFSA